MSFSRTRYGLQYDESPHHGGGGLPPWLLFAVGIPLLAILYLLLRGCDRQSEPTPEPAPSMRKTDVVPPREPPLKGSLLGRLVAGNDTPRQSTQSTPATPYPAAVQALIDQALTALGTDDLAAARDAYLAVRTHPAAGEAAALAEARIGELNVKLVLSPTLHPGKTTHVVVPGDTLGKLTRNYGVTLAYLMRINAIARPESLRIGQQLITLDNPQFTWQLQPDDTAAILFLGGQFFKRYPLAGPHASDSDNTVWINSPEGKRALRLALPADAAEIRLLVR